MFGQIWIQTWLDLVRTDPVFLSLDTQFQFFSLFDFLPSEASLLAADQASCSLRSAHNKHSNTALLLTAGAPALFSVKPCPGRKQLLRLSHKYSEFLIWLLWWSSSFLKPVTESLKMQRTILVIIKQALPTLHHFNSWLLSLQGSNYPLQGKGRFTDLIPGWF